VKERKKESVPARKIEREHKRKGGEDKQQERGSNS